MTKILYCPALLSWVFLITIAGTNTAGSVDTKKEAADTSVHPAAGNRIFPEGAQLQLISDRFAFTEGPSADKEGNVFFTDQPNNKIWQYATDGKLAVFLDKAGRSNGTCFDKEGNLITCADEHNELWHISKEGKIKVLAKDYKKDTLNGPNDVWTDSSGGIYITDPYFQRDYWKRNMPDADLGGERVYYLGKDKKALLVVDSNLVKPNGITGSADSRLLFVADIGAGVIYKYEIMENGMVSNRQVFVKALADGIRLDREGNLYCAGNGVTVFDKDGQQLAHLDVPQQWTANLCFGGKDRNILFITASKAVYTIPVLVRGAQ